MALAGLTFSDSLIVVETLAVLLRPPLDILVLRHLVVIGCSAAVSCEERE